MGNGTDLFQSGFQMSQISLSTALSSVNPTNRTTPVVRLGSGAGKPGPMLFAFLMVLQMAFTKGYPNHSLKNRNAFPGEYPEYNEYMSYIEYPVTAPAPSFQTAVDATPLSLTLLPPLLFHPTQQVLFLTLISWGYENLRIL